MSALGDPPGPSLSLPPWRSLLGGLLWRDAATSAATEQATTQATGAAEEASEYSQPDGTYSASPLQWVEYVGAGNVVQGTHGTHVSIDTASMLLTMRTPDGTTTFKISDDVMCFDEADGSTLSYIANKVSSCLAKSSAEMGPLQADGTRLSAMVYGDAKQYLSWTVLGGVITQISASWH